ncbi:unnamed protein product [Parnassius mnemosyne]|uniref:DUF4371 domain-containing protein n=1 Tax=Parnassius mnemosyne TaxID=213953 RepID=A0AAV1LM11_9NEOP
MIDETSDIKRLEQVSICFRSVAEDLTLNEYFIGFYDTKDTKAETLFEIVTDVIEESGLSIANLRGQCYDGASNVSGKITGLQTRIREVEPRALHVHCLAHSLNLVVQDSMEDIILIKNFIGIIKDLLNFIRDSPKRLGRFHDLQSEKSPDLTPFCPTRWTMRISSLKRLYHDANYQSVIDFMLLTSNARDTDAITSSKAKGFSKHLQTFETYFLLTTMINIFEAIELLNTQLQKSQLCLNESNKLVEISTKNLETQRDQKFEVIWKEANKGIAKFNVEEPSVRRERKTPRRFDSSSEAHIFDTPEDNYRKIYFEVYDKVLMSLNTRFETETINLLSKFENFLIGKNNINVLDITNFYNTQKKNESKEDNFDAQLLTNQRDFF